MFPTNTRLHTNHPEDAIQILQARFEPIDQMAFLVTTAEEKDLKLDLHPPVSAEMARTLFQIRLDIDAVASVVNRYCQRQDEKVEFLKAKISELEQQAA